MTSQRGFHFLAMKLAWVGMMTEQNRCQNCQTNIRLKLFCLSYFNRGLLSLCKLFPIASQQCYLTNISLFLCQTCRAAWSVLPAGYLAFSPSAPSPLSQGRTQQVRSRAAATRNDAHEKRRLRFSGFLKSPPVGRTGAVQPHTTLNNLQTVPIIFLLSLGLK